MVDERASMAARNNADWYELLFGLHGRAHERLPAAFVATDPPPPFHSWVVTIEPDLGGELGERIAEMAKQHDFVVKDSFCSLDLEPLRLVPFIEASWIFCAEPQPFDSSTWQRVEDAAVLARWEAAWSEGASSSDAPQFPVAVLHLPDVAIWARVHDGVIDAGVIANRSADCTGMSNVFGDDALLAAARLCWSFGEGRPVVGYEWDESLTQALLVGFQSVGELRICRRR